MAKKKGGSDRREPYFESKAEKGGLRARPEDRSVVDVKAKSSQKNPRKASAKHGLDPGLDEAAPAPRGRVRRARSRAAPPRGFLKRLFYRGVTLGVWAGIGLFFLVAYHALRLPQLADLKVPERPPNIAIMAADGTVMLNRGARGQAVALKDMPKTLPEAVIAIEDRRFYAHSGVDPLGLLRALGRNALSASVQEGGSTLTQQLAKNIFLTPERSLGRKVQELILSFWLEAKYSKSQILDMYLNRVYLGAGTYGVEAASQRYFGKSVRDIDLHESAMLAGLLKAPSRYAPTRSISAAQARTATVLRAMAEAGFITPTQAGAAAKQRFAVAKMAVTSASANYAADWVMDGLPAFVETIDQDIFVETTLDTAVQTAAEKALSAALDQEGKKYNVSQGAVVVLSPQGAVRALVGGRSYQDSQYNRAVTAKRQPGSAFKPFVYLTALEQGYTPHSTVEDAPLNIKGWKPENYSRSYRGLVPLHEALALSLNTAAVRLGMQVGLPQVVKTARRLGISSPLQANASLALGTSEVTPLELTGAFAAFANGGVPVKPYIVTRIRGKDGALLYQKPAAQQAPVINPARLADMNAMLAGVISYGTARRASLPGWEIAGKTGTSQDFRDAWFVGYSAHAVAGVWVGNDDGSPTKSASGSTLPVQIWSQLMPAAHANQTVASLPGLSRAPESPTNEPGIDDILVGGWSDENANAARRDRRDCPLDSGFLECVLD